MPLTTVTPWKRCAINAAPHRGHQHARHTGANPIVARHALTVMRRAFCELAELPGGTARSAQMDNLDFAPVFLQVFGDEPSMTLLRRLFAAQEAGIVD